jgi:hypothetical protein
MCQGKHRFGSFAEVRQALRRPGFGRSRRHRVEGYRCHYCRGWHVGGAPKVLQLRRRQRRAELAQEEEWDGQAEDR